MKAHDANARRFKNFNNNIYILVLDIKFHNKRSRSRLSVSIIPTEVPFLKSCPSNLKDRNIQPLVCFQEVGVPVLATHVQ